MILPRATQRHLLVLGVAALALTGAMTSAAEHRPAQSAAGLWDQTLDQARRIPINTAEADQLERLPGVGPALARRILADRAARGPYVTAQELERVPGIGPKLVERVQEYVTTE